PRAASPEKGRTVTEKYADATLRLLEGHGDDFGPLTPEAEKKLRRKLYLRLMILLSAINIMLFCKPTVSTLGYAAILGLFKETGVTPAQYNNLSTMFYVGTHVMIDGPLGVAMGSYPRTAMDANWPGHYLMQRLPFSKFVAAIISSWAVVILLHCVAVRYEGPHRAAEAVIVPAMEITIGMFSNRHEQSFLQPVLWTTCQAAPIVTGLVSYGLLWSTSTAVLPWKLLHVVTGGATLLLAGWVWRDYPANRAEARWLSLEEKVQVVRRMHASMQSSIEQKRFKREQFVETLKDPVSWLFALQSFTLMYANNLNYGQKNLITTSIGIDPLGSTLAAAAGGDLGVACCVIATLLLRRFPRNLALHGTVWCLPAVAGGIGMMAIDVYDITYIIALGWTTSTAAGYTKKLTRNVMFMVGYSVGNLVSPQIWVPSQGPRFYGAWASMIVVSWVGTPAILWLIRFILERQNKERMEWNATLSEDERDGGFVEQVDESGALVRVKVDIAVLDLTDLENKFFIYPL
ncbi:allantoate permease of the major facilitator superfamily, partial [Apiospora phragmitis]